MKNIFSSFSAETYVVDTQKNLLIDSVLLRIQNKCKKKLVDTKVFKNVVHFGIHKSELGIYIYITMKHVRKTAINTLHVGYFSFFCCRLPTCF